MTYLAVQGLLAIAFYPCFLILLSHTALYFDAKHRWKRITSLLIWLLSLIATIVSICYIQEPGTGLSVYLITSSIWLMFTCHYLRIRFNPHSNRVNSRAYCLILIIQPWMSSALLLALPYPGLSQGFIGDFLPLILRIESLRWVLTLILAVFTTLKHQQLRQQLILISMGSACFTMFIALCIHANTM